MSRSYQPLQTRRVNCLEEKTTPIEVEQGIHIGFTTEFVSSCPNRISEMGMNYCKTIEKRCPYDSDRLRVKQDFF